MFILKVLFLLIRNTNVKKEDVYNNIKLLVLDFRDFRLTLFLYLPLIIHILIKLLTRYQMIASISLLILFSRDLESSRDEIKN